MPQRIVPSLWFDKETEEAINLYISVFNGAPGSSQDSKIVSIQRYEKGMEVPGGDQLVGKVITAIFELAGYRFIALDGGPIFKLNPSVAFMLNFDPSTDKQAREKMDRMWAQLSPTVQFSCHFRSIRSANTTVGCRTNTGYLGSLSL